MGFLGKAQTQRPEDVSSCVWSLPSTCWLGQHHYAFCLIFCFVRWMFPIFFTCGYWILNAQMAYPRPYNLWWWDCLVEPVWLWAQGPDEHESLTLWIAEIPGGVKRNQHPPHIILSHFSAVAEVTHLIQFSLVPSRPLGSSSSLLKSDPCWDVPFPLLYWKTLSPSFTKSLLWHGVVSLS